jgi:hypothetical protein
MQKDANADDKNASDRCPVVKKLYQEPAFRHERVFETMALTCGKVQGTNFQCRFNRHTS